MLYPTFTVIHSFPPATATNDYLVISIPTYSANPTNPTDLSVPADTSLRRPIDLTIVDDQFVEESLEGLTVTISLDSSAPAAVSVVSGSQETAIEDNDGTCRS